MKSLENIFESMLWNSRLIILLPVIFGLLLAVGMFIVATVDALMLMGEMLSYMNPAIDEAARSTLRLDTISEVVAVVDGYLLAAIMVIFSLGLYELFVNKIDRAENSEFATRLLLIRNLDDLKDRLANVIMLILIVKFFQQALNLKYENPMDLLALAVGVILIAGALYLSGRANPKKALSVEK
jgi:uncharacterized membrane protein YqhA